MGGACLGFPGGFPEEEEGRTNKEGIPHPVESKESPVGVVVQQVKEGEQVGEDIRCRQHRVEEQKSQNRKHFQSSENIKTRVGTVFSLMAPR